MAVDDMHPSQFVPLVLVRVLNDAQAVDPEELEPKRVRDADSVDDGLREKGAVDLVGAVGGLVECRGAVFLFLVPHVAEGEVSPALASRED